jgi:putative ABC transport system ATP-binding protein
VLQLRGVRKSYGARQVLAGVDLDLAAGDFVAIMGESGSGKSTLLNLIAGLEPADAGSIRIEENDLSALDDDALSLLRRRRLGFVFQAFHVLPYLTVARNVALPLLLNGVPVEEGARRVAELLEAVGLSGRGESLPRELSGGETQRVAIARALAHRPALVLADEPTGNLDSAAAAQALGLLRDCVAREGAACLLVTHSAVAAAGADRVLRLGAEGLAAA